MKEIIFFGCISMMLMGNISCDKKDNIHPNVDFDYLFFGHFYGECFGEGCVEIFRIEDGKLYEDTLDQYPGRDDFYPGHFATLLPDAKFELVKDLESFFPGELLNETETVLGQPDAGDWGGIYVEIKNGSTHRFWLLDQMKSNMPAVYNDFVDKINEKIAIIHQ